MRGRVLLLFLVFAVACGKTEQGSVSETATSGAFELIADETLRPAVDSLITGFMVENPNAKVTVKYTSATEAVRELLNKQARAIVIARGLTPQERTVVAQDSTPLPDLLIAEDGIGCIVSNKNPIAALRLSSLRRMVHGEIKKWEDLEQPVVEPGGKPTGSIALALPEYPSSTEYLLDSMFIGSQEEVAKLNNAGYCVRFKTSDSVMTYVREHPSAIGFIGSAWKHRIDAAGDSGVKFIPIIPADSSSKGLTEPILLHMAYVYQGLYPLVTPVNGFSFEAPNTVPRGLLSYAMTAHGQRVFKNFDVLPKTQIIHIVPPRQ